MIFILFLVSFDMVSSSNMRKKKEGKSIDTCFSYDCYRMNHIFRFIDKIEFNSQIA